MKNKKQNCTHCHGRGCKNCTSGIRKFFLDIAENEVRLVLSASILFGLIIIAGISAHAGATVGFDFTSAGGYGTPGHIAIRGGATLYTPGQGYGWANPANIKEVTNGAQRSGVFKAGNTFDSNQFHFDVANGQYTLNYYFLSEADPINIKVTVENKTFTVDALAGVPTTKTVDVNVTDGRISTSFSGHGTIAGLSYEAANTATEQSAEVRTLYIIPNSIETPIKAGSIVQFKVNAVDADGKLLDNVNINFKVSNPRLAEVDANGAVRAKAAGTVTVTASVVAAPNISASATLNIAGKINGQTPKPAIIIDVSGDNEDGKKKTSLENDENGAEPAIIIWADDEEHDPKAASAQEKLYGAPRTYTAGTPAFVKNITGAIDKTINSVGSFLAGLFSGKTGASGLFDFLSFGEDTDNTFQSFGEDTDNTLQSFGEDTDNTFQRK